MNSNVINSELQQMETSASIALGNELVYLIAIKLAGAYPESNKNIPHTRLTMPGVRRPRMLNGELKIAVSNVEHGDRRLVPTTAMPR
jgi:hypothetical protein